MNQDEVDKILTADKKTVEWLSAYSKRGANTLLSAILNPQTESRNQRIALANFKELIIKNRKR